MRSVRPGKPVPTWVAVLASALALSLIAPVAHAKGGNGKGKGKPPATETAPPETGPRIESGAGRVVEATTTFGTNMGPVPKTWRSGNLDRRRPNRAVSITANSCADAAADGASNMVLSVPLAWHGSSSVNDPEGSLAAMQSVAAGAFDDVYDGIATELLACGFPSAVLRLGHEHNMQWTPWYSGDGRAGDYVEAWQRAADVVRARAPRIALDWNLGAGGADPDRPDGGDFDPASWPGDDYVDVVGNDIYCRGTGRNLAIVQDRLDRQLAFAASHGKPISFPELGVTLPIIGVEPPPSTGDDQRCSAVLDAVLGFADQNDLAYVTIWASQNESQGYRYRVEASDLLTSAVLDEWYA